jgi:hypothetical protein
MSDPTTIEAAARALYEPWDSLSEISKEYHRGTIRNWLETLTPLIEAAALERAAQVAEEMWGGHPTQDDIAAAIRALKEQP